MGISAIVLVLVCIANLSLGLFILMRDNRSAVTRSFFVLSVLISSWAVANYFTEAADSLAVNTLSNRLAYCLGFLAIASAAVFSRSFSQTARKKQIGPLAIILIAAMSVFSLTNYIAGEVIEESGRLVFEVGPLIELYIGAIALLLLLIIHDFYRVLRHGSQAQKSRARIMTVSLTLSILIGTVLNAVIPAISDNFHSAKFGPALLSLFFISTTSYAIIKHKLFDLKLIVARSFTYILSLASVALIFALTSFVITSTVLDGALTQVATEGFYTALAVILALTFPPLKKFFDQATSKLFYKDAYDTQDFLDELNKVLVSSYELQPLLHRSTVVISKHLKPAFCMFYLRPAGGKYPKLTGIKGVANTDEAKIIDTIQAVEPHIRTPVTTSDFLDDENTKFLSQLQKQHISVVARLDSGYAHKGINLGYLVFGVKKSGDLYSSKDINVIEIITNELAIAVQNALRFEEIEHFNLTLQAKVDEATRKLRRANEKLKELDETKDDFISMASHQLRTPLTSVKGYISMIMEGDAGKITHMQREMLGQAFFSSQRMVYLIADLLNVSRLKTGKFIIEPTPVNLASVVEEELGQLEETAAARSLTLTFNKPENFPTLLLDEVKIRQVIMNFTDNAIYYTPGGGHIEVKLIDKPGAIELRVTDDGIGVPKSEQPHLFTKFYRAGNARKARPDGTGLGLFMAKKVVVAQGGSLIFESKEGKGSTFGFVFSKSKLAPPKPAAPATPDKITHESVKTH